MVKTVDLYGFCSVQSLEAVTEFMEKYTGKGTVYAVKVFHKDGKARASAIVQFTHAEFADMILTVAGDHLEKSVRYGNSFLKVKRLKHDMFSKSVTFQPSMELVKLHFGCQISNEQFSVLWTLSDVSVKFGMILKHFYFFFSHDSIEYKLEISYDNVSQIELHRPHGQLAKFLLIQLCGAPRIYKKDVPDTNNIEEASATYWVREVDFTPSCRIGQSSAVCLELPLRWILPNLGSSFVHYKADEGRFVLERGNIFSCDSDLVPIVRPPLGIKLPYKVLFKINSLVQHGCVPGQALDANFYELVDPTRIRIEDIECALDKLFHLKECCYEPVSWLREQYRKYQTCKRIPETPAISLDDGLVYVHRVQITPSKVYFCGPEVNHSNRLFRKYPKDVDNFLRVSFVDEDLGKMRSADLCPRAAEQERRTRVYERILSTLRNGIVIGEKKFEFLAFSSSQLRGHSVWMFASRSELKAQDIRNWMGDFNEIRNVAKHAARLGQSFSSSKEAFTVGEDEVELIPDVEIERDGVEYCFSDGIGKISAEFAARVARKFKLSCTPSAFQIRYGGYKGVLAVDPTLSKNLSLRKSMCKYQSNNTTLDVLKWSKYQPYFLNRELITLLSTLGVPDDVFMEKQKWVLNQLDGVLADPLRAQEALELMFQGEATNILKEMVWCGYTPDAEPFLAMMLQAYCASKLLELQSKTRIFVPDGRSMMGCLDETGTLEYGQVFVQCSPHGSQQLHDTSSHIFSGSSSSDGSFIVQGKVLVAKNPCLHPGDVRVLMAVNVPALHHMVDCVVFPQKGERPHPHECSGGDLDGDFYWVSWDPDLIPPCQVQPMNYTPEPTTNLDHDVTMEEIEESFVNHIVHDNLGIISSAHTVFADREQDKAMSAPCQELAKLNSCAVDSPKTGVLVKLPYHLRAKEYPEFMEKLDRPTYKSKGVIGKLFQQVNDHVELVSHLYSSSAKSFTMEVAWKCYDPDMTVDGFEVYINEAINYKREYDYKLGNLMEYYGIKSEAEILSGNITQTSKYFNRRKDFKENIGHAVRSLKTEARGWFHEKQGSDIQSNVSINSDDAYAAKASAWYHVTYHPHYFGCYNEGMAREHFLSFPWCVFDKLIQIKRDKRSIKTSLHMLSPTCHST
ncbi:probable RNA-dependent RNA polymerase 1 [Prunus avium]|uniref:RNA-dependent RNA polymerase n=1 Tax=Prunus avium TaxID=42229 RepID=A0A6P5U569_PRUAV|nr:probable RNA-dependent RNA polymerase 1 [Prunus avium]